jgi:L-gulono-1,4-lactone dehydrogenase
VKSWSNWDGSVRASPVELHTPASTEEIAFAVARAREQRRAVRFVGSGHSWSDVAVTGGVMLDGSKLRGIEAVDRDSGRVTVRAGTPLWMLNRELAEHGLALPIVGAIDRQTIAGAIATGTHGTGLGYGPLSSYVEAVTIVSADGEIISGRPELLPALRCNLGCIGILTRVVLRCEPSFRMLRVERKRSLDDVLKTLEHDRRTHEHYGAWWVPHADQCLTIEMNRTTEPARGRRVQRFLTNHLVRNGALDLLTRVVSLRPSSVRTTNRLVAALTPESDRWIDDGYRLFSMPFRVPHRECEYAVPIEKSVEVIEALRRMIHDGGHHLSLFVDIRFVAASDAWLDPAHGRASCFLSIAQHASFDFVRLFDAFEELMLEHGGRPHWGKHSRRFTGELRARYPGWDAFFSVRDQLDPEGVFVTPFVAALRV